MRQVTIKPLETGFIVEHGAAAVAALTTPDDLVDWITNEYGATRIEPVVERVSYVDEAVGVVVEEIAPPQPSQPAIETVQAEAEPEADTKPAKPHPFSGKAASELLDKHADQLVGWFRVRGAETKWVKATYVEIGDRFGVKAPTVQKILERAKRLHSDFRSCRVVRGELQGNHYTLNPDIAEPTDEAPVKKIEVACKSDASDLQAKVAKAEEAAGIEPEKRTVLDEVIPAATTESKRVLNFINEVFTKKGSPQHFAIASMSARVHVNRKKLPDILQALHRRGEIVLRSSATNSDPWIGRP